MVPAGLSRDERLFKPLAVAVEEQRTWALSPHPRIGTGYSIMDSRTRGGAAQGELILFTARSGVGKTTFGLNVIANNPNVPAVVFSLEMHARYLVTRLAAISTGATTEDIEETTMRTGTHPALQEILERFPRLAIVDRPGLSFRSMGRALREAAEAWGEPARLVVIDFLELVGGIRALSSAESVDSAMKAAKDFAREHDVVLLMLHQVSRGAGGDGHEPLTATAGRFGGEQSADYILAAYRRHLDPELGHAEMLAAQRQYHLQFLKTRGGSEIHPGGVALTYNPQTMRITDPNPSMWNRTTETVAEPLPVPPPEEPDRGGDWEQKWELRPGEEPF